MLGTHNFVSYGSPPYCEVHMLVFTNEQQRHCQWANQDNGWGSRDLEFPEIAIADTEFSEL
jgi:hypothetical protein